MQPAYIPTNHSSASPYGAASCQPALPPFPHWLHRKEFSHPDGSSDTLHTGAHMKLTTIYSGSPNAYTPTVCAHSHFSCSIISKHTQYRRHLCHHSLDLRMGGG